MLPEDDAKTWKWTDGSTFKYKNWNVDKGQPDVSGGDGPAYIFMFYNGNGGSDNGKWFDGKSNDPGSLDAVYQCCVPVACPKKKKHCKKWRGGKYIMHSYY